MLSTVIKEEKVPVIDREIFFGNPEILSGKLSPDGVWIAFAKAYNGIMNIWVKKTEESFENARPLTDSKRPLTTFYWTSDSKYLVFVKDHDGDENLNIFAVSPYDKVNEGELPTTRNLTPFKNVASRIYKINDKDPDTMMIGLNDRDKSWYDLYKLRVSDGELKLIYENKDRIAFYDYDWNDDLRILYKKDENGSTTLLFKKDDGLVPIYQFDNSETVYTIEFNEENSKFYLVSNKGDVNLTTLYLFDPETKEAEKIESDPNNRVNINKVWINRLNKKIISTIYIDDKMEYNWHDKELEKLYTYLESKFPDREISFTSYTKDYTKLLIAITADKYAPEVYLFNTKTKELIFQYTPLKELKNLEKYLSPMKPIRYKSSDGLEIPGYLTIPYGFKPQNLPLVVIPHGGPKGFRDYWEFNPVVQFLANRGYAVFQPNFRASGGYGKFFQNAGDLEWGKLMQDDITWGVKYLIEEGIADSEKVVIFGGSYGGYAALAGLAFTPDLYAAGISVCGPSNLFTLLKSIPPYWESLKASFYASVGNPDTEEGKAILKKASPLFSVDKMNKPLLVAQGANDPRVKQVESDQIVIALRDKGKKVRYLLADDEGHGFHKPINNMAKFVEIENFLSEILGGRCQKDMPDEVAKRLKEITVDISALKSNC